MSNNASKGKYDLLSIGHYNEDDCQIEHPNEPHNKWEERIIIEMIVDAGVIDKVYKEIGKRYENFSPPAIPTFNNIPMDKDELFYFLPKKFLKQKKSQWDKKLMENNVMSIIKNKRSIPKKDNFDDNDDSDYFKISFWDTPVGMMVGLFLFLIILGIIVS